MYSDLYTKISQVEGPISSFNVYKDRRNEKADLGGLLAHCTNLSFAQFIVFIVKWKLGT